MASKRVLVISDTHCGHRVGLTPPDWQLRFSSQAEMKRNKWANFQHESWKWFEAKKKEIGKVDLLITAGDTVDGEGYRSGGIEQITTDMNIQVDMATAVIKSINAKNVVMVSGTPYHTGDGADFEEAVARNVKATKYGDHEWIDVNGVMFDVKHHADSSSVPYGSATPLLKEWFLNGIWAEENEQPRADILLRGHVHTFNYAGGALAGLPYLVATLPALQGMGSRYGARQCSKHVDFGMIEFNITSREDWTWRAHIAKLGSQQARSLTL